MIKDKITYLTDWFNDLDVQSFVETEDEVSDSIMFHGWRYQAGQLVSNVFIHL